MIVKVPPSRYEVRPFPRSRRIVVDGGRANAKRHAMVGLIEMDVTAARERIREHERATGQRLSFTAFVVACLGRAVAAEPSAHDVVDGAPAARFTARLRELIGSAELLDQL